ncbi:MAG: hypothetical protein J6V24_05495 [Clostridia bacterium]|nr:hypothetical protein [Clostridia bacterium]
MTSVLNRVHVGEAELVRADRDFDFTLDAPFVPLRNGDGRWRLLQTTFCEPPYYHAFTGTVDNLFAESGTYEMDYNGYIDFRGSGVWIMSAYKFPDGMLAGFCHRELIHPSDPGFGNCFFIGLAVSHDGGNRWRYLGDIAGNVVNGHRYLPNMGGCPLLVRGGWFHIYFNDYDETGLCRVTAARMRMDETEKALHEDRLPQVFKYTGSGVRESDPMKTTGARILPDVGFHPDSHAKGVYCRPLDRWLLTMQTNAEARLLLFFSEDCERFDEHLILDEAEPGVWMQPYSFFLSADGDCSDDMNEVGSRFYVYYPRKGLLGQNIGYDHDDLYRRLIVVE